MKIEARVMRNKISFKKLIPLIMFFSITIIFFVAVFVYALPDETDRIHFLNVGSADAIVIESNGHYGIVDAANPSPSHSKYGYTSSNQNGQTVINYLKKLGAKNLDFVIGTHSHSDHIGGIPDVADGLNSDGSNFVNSNTTYIYKKYTYVSSEESQGWHNSDFCNEARDAMQNKGANILETTEHNSSALNKLGASFVSNNEDKVLDYIEFNFYDYNIKIFSLYNVATTQENVNSLVTLVTKGNTKTLLMADMEHIKGTEQKIGKYVGKVNLFKVGHHGYNDTSFALMDYTNPEYAIYSNESSINLRSFPIIFFRHLGTKLYRTGEVTDSIVATINSDITLKTYAGGTVPELSQTLKFDNNQNPPRFYQVYDEKDQLEWIYVKKDNTLTFDWAYLSWNNKSHWYYFNKRGIMETGWLDLSDGTYYCAEKTDNNYDRGAMVTGWQQLSRDGKSSLYYFVQYKDVGTSDFGSYKEGQMVTGWQYVKNTDHPNGWYYFKSDEDKVENYQKGARLANGWFVLPDEDNPSVNTGYYFESNGVYNFKKDTTAPTAVVTGNTKTPSLSVTLKISTAYDCPNEGVDCIGLPEDAFSFNGGESWTSSNTQTFTQNGLVNIWVRDKAGNTKKLTENITSIDSDGPKILGVDGNRNTWSKDNVTLTIKATDMEGLHALPYSFDDGDSWQASPSKTYIENTSNIRIKVRDIFGNETSYEPINITKIKRVSSISMKTPISKTTYTKNTETLSVSGGTILVKYNNGDEETISLDISMTSGFSNTTLGNKSITVKYIEPETGKLFTTKFNVTIVAKEVNSILMNTYPKKTDYVKGSKETLDLSGASIKVNYNDNSTEIIYLPDVDVSVTDFDNSSTGSKKITLTYENEETSFNINVIDKKITSIRVTTPPKKTEYIINYDKELDLTDGILTIYYNDNTSRELSLNDNSIKTSGFVNTSLGRKEITVTYEGYSTSFYIEIINKKVKNIKLTKTPTKMDYVENYDVLDLTGAELTVTYTDETKNIISLPNSSVTYTGFSNKTVGTSKVTIVYEGFYDTLTVNIVPKSITSIELSTNPIKRIYLKDSAEILDLSGGVLKINYNNNSWEYLNLPNELVTTSEFDNKSTGFKTITLSYQNFQTTLTVEVIDNNLNIQKIEIETLPSKKTYIQNYEDELILTGGILKVTYDNGYTRLISLTSSEITYEGFDNRVVGYNTIKVKYNDFVTTFQVQIVSKSISSISLKREPDKKEYIEEYENLDLTGAILLINYNDKSMDTIALPNNSLEVSGFNNRVLGENTITLKYNGFTTTFKVQIIPKSVTGISLDVKPLRETYIQGSEEEIDLYGGVITVNYSNGTSGKVSLTNSKISISGFNTKTLGSKIIAVSYEGYETSFTINVVLKEIKKIEVSKLPNKVKYMVSKEDLDLNGGELLVTYNDESTDKISLTNKYLDISGFDNEEVGMKTITVKYQGLSTSFEVTVIDKALERIEMDTLPWKLDYLEGYEELDLEGGVIKAIYNDGEIDKVSLTNKLVTVSGFDNTKVGVNTLTVSYEGLETTFDVNIISKKAIKLEFVKPVTKLDYLLNKELLKLDGGIVKITYNNGTSEEVSLPDERFTIIGFDNTILGEQTIALKYQDLAITFKIKVYYDEKGDRGDNPKTGINGGELIITSLFVISVGSYMYLKKFKKSLLSKI